MAAVSRHPSPPTGRAAHAGRSFVAAALVALGLTIGHLPVASGAAAADASAVLDRTLEDVAFVERGPGRSPDLLTLDVDESSFGVVHVSLLRRTTTWASVAEVSVTLELSFDGNSPWLMPLGADRIAIISTTSTGLTLVNPIAVDTASEPALRVLPSAAVELVATEAGVADTTGDGTAELILVGYSPGLTDPCPPPLIAVLSVGDESSSIVGPKFIEPHDPEALVRVAGGALGEFDGRPGVDLLTHAYEGCPDDSDVVERHHLLAIRLADLSTIVDIPTADGEALIAAPWSSPLSLIDVDDDGRDEAIMTTDMGLKIVDPVDRWRSTTFGDPGAVLLAPMRPASGGASAVWLQRANDPASSGITTARLTRVDGSLRVDEAAARPLPGVSTDDLEAARALIQSTALNQYPAPVLIADLDLDGCADISAPLVSIGCAGSGSIERGPTWLDSRPIGVVGESSDHRLLVAVGVDWYPYFGGPIAPSPAAGRPPGAWRYGPSNRFVLAEVPLPSTDATLSAPVAAPTMDDLVSTDGIIELKWATGTRLLMRVSRDAPTGPTVDAAAVMTRHGFLYGESFEGEFAGALSAFGLESTDDGAGTSTQRFDLPTHIQAVTGTLADRWTVTIAALDPSGALSDPVQATAILDRTAPPLTMETPMLTPPWPFGATLHGSSEAGASVSLPGAVAVSAGPDGSFELPAQLAPWPQTLEVTAVDLAGNKAVSKVSVMGGADVRGLPWAAIGAVVLLIGVVLSSIRGVRRRQPAAGSHAAGDDATPEIEELPVRPLRPD